MSQASLVPKIGVASWVIREGQTLLGRRKNSHGNASWACPGGHLEFGESPFQTAIREVKEETNLDVHQVVAGPWTNDFFPDENKHYLTLHLFITGFSGELNNLEPNKNESWEWFQLDELPEPLFQTIESLLKMGSLQTHLEKAKSELSLP